MKNYTKEEIEFLKENYPIFGGEYCSLELHRTKNSILAKTKRLNISLNDDIKSKIKSNNSLGWYNKISDESYNVGYEQFKNINKSEIAYILGFLWSDGYCHKKNNTNSIVLEIVREDLDEIKHIFDSVGKWGYYFRKREGRKEIASLKTSNRPLLEYLYTLDFNRKSFISPDKLINKIPLDLRKYFFRGIIDGDGCFYFDSKRLRLFSVTSSIDQDWKYLKDLFDNLGIEYNIRNKEHNNKDGNISHSSVIYVTGIERIKKLGDYIYDGYEIDKIGLKRKYEKYLNCII